MGSVGIIGGADGPTAVFVNVPVKEIIIISVIAALVIAAVTVWIILRRKKRK